jgi:hypothetical protein
LESNQGFKAVQGFCVVAPPSGHGGTIGIEQQKAQRKIAVSVNDAGCQRTGAPPALAEPHKRHPMMSGMHRIRNSVLAALPAVLMFVPAHAETRLFTDYDLELCDASRPGESHCTELSGGIEVKLTGATRRDASGRTLYEATTADGATRGWITEAQRKGLLSDDRVQTSCSENLRIGMSEEEVLASCWGKPRSRRRTGVEGLIRDQWSYGDGRYLYFDNGRLFAIE